MSSVTSFTITLEHELLQLLDQGAVTTGLTRQQLVVEAIEQQLEVALRHRVLLSRLEEMDRHIVALAEFIGEATATPDETEMSSFCRYRPEREGTVE